MAVYVKGKESRQKKILNENRMEIYMLSQMGDKHKRFNRFEGYVVRIPEILYELKIQELLQYVYYHGIG